MALEDADSVVGVGEGEGDAVGQREADAASGAVGPCQWRVGVVRARRAFLIEVALTRAAALRAAEEVGLGDGLGLGRGRRACEGAEDEEDGKVNLFHIGCFFYILRAKVRIICENMH